MTIAFGFVAFQIARRVTFFFSLLSTLSLSLFLSLSVLSSRFL